MAFEIRYAAREDLPQVNELRSQVNRLHAEGRPDIFRSGFCEELRERVYAEFEGEDSDVIVAVSGGTVLVAFCTEEAKKKGFSKMELDVWEFNEDARKFYKAVGFQTYRRYMELDVL